ncbi:hypothetical protein [Salinicola avicenniae]|uniref:hypothetical protein n=1 Tax=Salinicola avicenniae TaxID=2916836 RepID=UPI0020745CBB|nr:MULTISPECIES: hypothetical protein [unclassified Salinicola]
MSDQRHTQNAAWQAAQQWKARVDNSRPSPGAGGLKMLFTWLLFGAMLIVGTLLGLFLLIVGWAMLPFLRHRMKKRAEQVRASQAQYAGGSAEHDPRSNQRASQQVLDGEYEVRSER